MKRQRGMLLIEVLVTIFISAIALLGTIALSVKSSRNQMESYQRVQALTLVQDMVSRLNANRQVAACYSSGSTGVVTTSTTLPACTTAVVAGSTTQQQATANADLATWKSELQGASEVNSGSKVGAMTGAIGCVTQTSAVNNTYRITVVWQGFSSTVAPTLSCGKGNFSDDTMRRAVSVKIQIGNLTT